MEKRHHDEITNRLEHIQYTGVTHILWSELFYWYRAKEISMDIWQDITRRWEIVLNKHPLKKVETSSGVYLIDECKIQNLLESKKERKNK